jgi:hypothetical protein
MNKVELNVNGFREKDNMIENGTVVNGRPFKFNAIFKGYVFMSIQRNAALEHCQPYHILKEAHKGLHK